mmetsp:Transcript_4219/g.14112  ORF Transcript_4219/g.14112 Transcript_4219/m.14112 type:complete len:244 (-) Transcript_4219:113-844(-)
MRWGTDRAPLCHAQRATFARTTCRRTGGHAASRLAPCTRHGPPRLGGARPWPADAPPFASPHDPTREHLRPGARRARKVPGYARPLPRPGARGARSIRGLEPRRPPTGRRAGSPTPSARGTPAPAAHRRRSSNRRGAAPAVGSTSAWSPGSVCMSRLRSMALVSGSTGMASVSTADTSGMKSRRRSRSSSWSLREMPRTGPRWMRFMRCVANPAILFFKRLLGMTATSSQMRLLVWKSMVSRW